MDILRSHVIDTDAMTADDFEGFFSKRREALLSHIEQATGKTIARQAYIVEADIDDIEVDLEETNYDQSRTPRPHLPQYSRGQDRRTPATFP